MLASCKWLTLTTGMYMTGNTLQIFSVFMVFTLFKTPVLAVLGLQRTFAPYESPGTAGRLLGVKLVYIACNLLMLALGIWKVNAMGLHAVLGLVRNSATQHSLLYCDMETMIQLWFL